MTWQSSSWDSISPCPFLLLFVHYVSLVLCVPFIRPLFIFYLSATCTTSVLYKSFACPLCVLYLSVLCPVFVLHPSFLCPSCVLHPSLICPSCVTYSFSICPVSVPSILPLFFSLALRLPLWQRKNEQKQLATHIKRCKGSQSRKGSKNKLLGHATHKNNIANITKSWQSCRTNLKHY